MEDRNVAQQPEITMRPASYYYLAQIWRPQEHPQTQRRTLRVASRGRHAARRDYPARALPVVARRVLAMLSGTSQAA